MASPKKEGSALMPPPEITSKPAHRTHRTIRRLNSAHTLGASFYNTSLIHQQRQQQVAVGKGGRDDSTTVSTATQNHHRVRSNSDASTTREQAMSLKKQNSGLMRKAGENISLDRMIRDGPENGLPAALEAIRLKILDQGIKSDNDGMSPLRIYVWLILLNAPLMDTDSYLSLIHRASSPAYAKIRNDTFRTMTTDPLFRRRVSEASLIRLLNAVAWKLHDAREARNGGMVNRPKSPTKPRASIHMDDSPQTSPFKNRQRALTLTTEGSDAGASEPGTYVQGMNVLAAPFLYAARSESEAFAGFYRFITHEVPGYVRGAMDGVHKGVSLVDRVLSIVDPKLSMYLMKKGQGANLYAFGSVLTLCACTPPLPEVLKLWDFLFSYGAHLNILCIVAQLIMMRTQIMESPSPVSTVLRKFPPLQADTIKELTLSLVKKIPDNMYAEIVAHAK